MTDTRPGVVLLRLKGWEFYVNRFYDLGKLWVLVRRPTKTHPTYGGLSYVQEVIVWDNSEVRHGFSELDDDDIPWNSNDVPDCVVDDMVNYIEENEI